MGGGWRVWNPGAGRKAAGVEEWSFPRRPGWIGRGGDTSGGAGAGGPWCPSPEPADAWRSYSSRPPGAVQAMCLRPMSPGLATPTVPALVPLPFLVALSTVPFFPLLPPGKILFPILADQMHGSYLLLIFLPYPWRRHLNAGSMFRSSSTYTA